MLLQSHSPASRLTLDAQASRDGPITVLSAAAKTRNSSVHQCENRSVSAKIRIAGSILNEAARRAKIYADAGADGIFVPGLTDLALIGKFVHLTPLPVNIMVTQGVPQIEDLARVGVRRVSLGPWPMMAAMRVVGQAAAALAASKQYGTFLQPNA